MSDITLEKKFKIFMHSKHLTVRGFCADMGMSTTNLYDVYKRNNIDTKYLRLIEEKYNVPVYWFFVEDIGNGVNVVGDKNKLNDVGNVSYNEKEYNKEAVKALKKEVALLRELVKTKDLLIDNLTNEK